MSHGLRFEFPVRLPHVGPSASDRLQEEVAKILASHAYPLALLFNRSAAAPAIRGSVSLTADGVATTTTITNDLIETTSLLVLTPNDAGAAAEVGSAGGVYVTYAAGVATITHSASVAARTFRYVLLP